MIRGEKCNPLENYYWGSVNSEPSGYQCAFVSVYDQNHSNQAAPRLKKLLNELKLLEGNIHASTCAVLMYIFTVPLLEYYFFILPPLYFSTFEIQKIYVFLMKTFIWQLELQVEQIQLCFS